MSHAKHKNFLAKHNLPLIADGAWATRIMAHGFSYEIGLDQLNISHPQIIKEVAQEYVDAGAEIIKTNTFNASLPRLQTYQLAKNIDEINTAGVSNIKELSTGVLIAGTIGPIAAPQTLSETQIYRAVQQQGNLLIAAGVDLLIIETATAYTDTFTMVKALRSLSDLTIICSFSPRIVAGNWYLADNYPLPKALENIQTNGANYTGINCLDTITMQKLWQDMAAYQELLTYCSPSVTMPLTASDKQALSYLLENTEIMGTCCGSDADTTAYLVQQKAKMLR